MKLKTFVRSILAGFVISLSTPSLLHAKDPIPVVATFSILGDLVKQIGGKHISLRTLVGPDGDAHVYKPTPADAKAVSNAKVLFVNGLVAEIVKEQPKDDLATTAQIPMLEMNPLDTSKLGCAGVRMGSGRPNSTSRDQSDHFWTVPAPRRVRRGW